MLRFYRIAGLTVKMDVSDRTLKQAEPYLCQPVEKADINIPETTEKFKEGYHTFSDEDIEYMFTGTIFALSLLRNQGFVLHASAVVVDDKAYLFSATSGTGKSTHTELWLKQFGDRAYILNDDKPALRLIDGVWYACGTPWSGKNDISKPVMVPLAGIAMIERDTVNHIEPAGVRDATYKLLSQTARKVWDQDLLMEHLDKLIRMVPVWNLYCNMDPEAALVSYRAMSGVEKELGK